MDDNNDNDDDVDDTSTVENPYCALWWVQYTDAYFHTQKARSFKVYIIVIRKVYKAYLIQHMPGTIFCNINNLSYSYLKKM